VRANTATAADPVGVLLQQLARSRDPAVARWARKLRRGEPPAVEAAPAQPPKVDKPGAQ
jgi:hypothetical protein